VAYRTPEKILSGGFPGTVDHPSDPNESEREVRGGDRHETKERYWCGWVAPRPEVNWDKCERRG